MIDARAEICCAGTLRQLPKEEPEQCDATPGLISMDTGSIRPKKLYSDLWRYKATQYLGITELLVEIVFEDSLYIKGCASSIVMLRVATLPFAA